MPLTNNGVIYDREVLGQIEPIMGKLWRPLRFLADLKSVWPELSVAERREIECARTFRERHHERLAAGYVTELQGLTPQIRSVQFRRLREEMELFLEHWDTQEPDKVRVLSAMIRSELDAR